MRQFFRMSPRPDVHAEYDYEPLAFLGWYSVAPSLRNGPGVAMACQAYRATRRAPGDLTVWSVDACYEESKES